MYAWKRPVATVNPASRSRDTTYSYSLSASSGGAARVKSGRRPAPGVGVEGKLADHQCLSAHVLHGQVETVGVVGKDAQVYHLCGQGIRRPFRRHPRRRPAVPEFRGRCRRQRRRQPQRTPLEPFEPVLSFCDSPTPLMGKAIAGCACRPAISRFSLENCRLGGACSTGGRRCGFGAGGTAAAVRAGRLHRLAVAAGL